MTKLIALLMGFLLSGCGFFSANSQNALKNEMLAYTQKFEDTSARVLVLGTYLNPSGSSILSDIENEHFIISVYPQNSQILADSITFNGDKIGAEMRKLESDDPLVKSLSVQTPWADFYYIKTQNIASDLLEVRFLVIAGLDLDAAGQSVPPHQTSGGSIQPLQVYLRFVKTPKSLYWNPK